MKWQAAYKSPLSKPRKFSTCLDLVYQK